MKKIFLMLVSLLCLTSCNFYNWKYDAREIIITGKKTFIHCDFLLEYGLNGYAIINHEDIAVHYQQKTMVYREVDYTIYYKGE